MRPPRVEDFEGLCHHHVDGLFAPGLTRQDLLQEARFGAWKGIRDHRPERGASLVSFVSTCIKRQVLTAIVFARRGKHQPLNESMRVVVDGDNNHEIVEAVDYLEDHKADVVDIVLARERLAEAARLLRERLSDLELACLLGEVHGESYREMALRLGVGEKAIDNALQRARIKLKAPGAGGRSLQVGRCKCPECGGPAISRSAPCNVCRHRELAQAA